MKQLFIGVIDWFTRDTVYCDYCAERDNWPITNMRGYGQCQTCKQNQELNIIKIDQ